MRSLLVVLALLGAACGAPAETPRAAGGSSPAPAPLLAATSVPAPAASIAPTSPPPAATASPAPPGADAGSYKGIPTSRTADGFHVLGAPEAPVTIVDYSDFL